MVNNYVVKKGLLRIVVVTTQDAISRRLSSFKHERGDRQEARMGNGGDDKLTPMA